MKDQTYWPEMARRSEKCAGPALMLRAVMRKSAFIYMTVIRQRVASLTLDCNGVFAIKAYSQFFLKISSHFQSQFPLKGTIFIRNEVNRQYYLGYSSIDPRPSMEQLKHPTAPNRVGPIRRAIYRAASIWALQS